MNYLPPRDPSRYETTAIVTKIIEYKDGTPGVVTLGSQFCEVKLYTLKPQNWNYGEKENQKLYRVTVEEIPWPNRKEGEE